MRRAALRVAALPFAALMVAALWPSVARALVLKPAAEGYARIVPAGPGPSGPGQAVETWGYWGRLNYPAGTKWGSYRGTCFWLTDGSWPDDRYFCTVVLSRGRRLFTTQKPPGGSITVQGLIRRSAPSSGLFAKKSMRRLPITGGTGPYADWAGYVDLRGAPGAITIVNP
jgi:hypothetical protein